MGQGRGDHWALNSFPTACRFIPAHAHFGHNLGDLAGANLRWCRGLTTAITMTYGLADFLDHSGKIGNRSNAVIIKGRLINLQT